MTRVAIFGGSFDPVHLGHLELARCAREEASLDRVIFMPCWQSPFKGKTIATGEQRFEMLKLAVKEDWAEVSEYEISRPKPSYSWETVQTFQKDSTDVEWCWILGTDQWNQIEKWAEPERLREGLHFIVMTRNGESVESKRGWRHTAVSFSHPASSTKIREDFKAHKEWLADGVADYCERHSIYI